MKRHGNLFPRIVNICNIYKAYLKARHAKGWMKSVKEFESDLENNLLKVQNLLIDKTFTTSPYKSKFVYEPKLREIFVVPFAPDRIVQHALMSVVEPIWDKLMIDNTCSCRKGRGVQRAYELARQYVHSNKYYLKCDISKFYPSINHDILFDIIQRKIKCKDTLWLLKDIVYSFGRQYGTETNSPIGNYTSQWFGNLYLDIMDQRATHEYKIDYVRYCDDFIFFSDDKGLLKEIQASLPDSLAKERKLRLSKCELFPTRCGLDFIGYRFFPDYILLRKRVAKSIKGRFTKIKTICNDPTNKSIMCQIASSYGLLKRCDSYNLRQALQFEQLARTFNMKIRS